MENLLAVLGADSLASALSGAGYDVVSGEVRDVADTVRASGRPVAAIVFAGAGPTAGVWARAQTAAGHLVAWLRPTDGPSSPAGAVDVCLPAAIGDVLTGLGVPLIDDAVAVAWVLDDGTVGTQPRPVQQLPSPAITPSALDEAGSDDWWLPADVLSAVEAVPPAPSEEPHGTLEDLRSPEVPSGPDDGPVDIWGPGGPFEPGDEPPGAPESLWGASATPGPASEPVEPLEGPAELPGAPESLWGPSAPPEPASKPPGVMESLWGTNTPLEPPDSPVEPLDGAQAPDASVEPPGVMEDLWGTESPPEPAGEPPEPSESLRAAQAHNPPPELAGEPIDIMEDLWGAPQGPAPRPAPAREAEHRPSERRSPARRPRAPKPDRGTPRQGAVQASGEPAQQPVNAPQPSVPRASGPRVGNEARQWPTTAWPTAAQPRTNLDEDIDDLWLAGGQPSRRRAPGALAPMAVVLAAKGGVGVTTFAVALAERAATNLGLERVIVVDASGRDGLRPVLWAPEGELPTLYDATIQDDPSVALAMPGALAAVRPPGMPTPHFAAVLGAPAGLFLAPFARAKVAQAMTGVLALAREVADLVVVDVGTTHSSTRGSAGPNPAQVAPVDAVALLTAPGAWGVGLFDDSRDSFSRLAVWWGARKEALAGSHWVIIGNRLSSPPAVDMAAVERFASSYGAALTSLVADQAGTKRATSTGGWADAPDWLAALDAVLAALAS